MTCTNAASPFFPEAEVAAAYLHLALPSGSKRTQKMLNSLSLVFPVEQTMDGSGSAHGRIGDSFGDFPINCVASLPSLRPHVQCFVKAKYPYRPIVRRVPRVSTLASPRTLRSHAHTFYRSLRLLQYVHSILLLYSLHNVEAAASRPSAPHWQSPSSLARSVAPPFCFHSCILPFKKSLRNH